jgi:hypothetical protein
MGTCNTTKHFRHIQGTAQYLASAGNNLTKCPIRDGVAHRISIMCRRDLDHPPISDPTVIQALRAGTISWTQAPRSQRRGASSVF